MDQGLTADEAAVWREYRRMHLRLMTALDRQLARDASMPQGYYAVLATLASAPDQRLLLVELARRCNFSQSRLSHALTRMEESGWVRREAMAEHRRSSWAVLTDAGRQAQVAAAHGHDAEVRRLVFDPLSADQVRQLDDICRTLNAHLGPEEDRGGGDDLA